MTLLALQALKSQKNISERELEREKERERESSIERERKTGMMAARGTC